MTIRWPVFVMVCAMALGVVGAGCEEEHLRTPADQQTADTRAADQAAIRAASQEWSNAASTRDLEQAVSFYADDATYHPPGAPLAAGKDAIRKVWTNVLAMPGVNLRWATSKVEVARSGDLAYDTGAYTLTKNDSSGKPVTTKGKYVVVWKKQADGKWKVIEDIDNPDQ
jgi:uncharacterized protein (TIGR02246 family)